ncbi:MAG: DUF6089 family protein [Bacteroidota bacterium]
MLYKKIILSSVIVFVLSLTCQAQRAELGVNVGGAGYMGDLNQFNPVKISGVAVGIYAKINFDPHWGLGLHYNYGKIKAFDALSDNPQFVDRNLHFKTVLNEVSFIGSFNFFDIYSPGSKGRLTPYLFAGIGGVIFNPKATYLGSSANGGFELKEFELRDFNTEGQVKPYRNYAVVIPYGAGVKFKMNENWTLFSQAGYRTAFTDYLDDVSGVYPDPSKLLNGISRALSDRSGELTPTGVNLYKPGDQRGDFRKRDTYLFVNIGISYTFVSQKCFTF